jgi:hypothetical protein
MRQAGLLVQEHGGGLGVGAELTGSRAAGVGGLQGMAALHAPAAVLAGPAMDVELPMDRLPGNLGLVLLDDRGFRDVAAAGGAEVGQRRVLGFVDLVGRGRWAMAVAAVGLARFTPRSPGMGLGFALAERGGLPLAGPARLVEQAGEFPDPLLQFGHPLLQGLASRAVGLAHAAIVAVGPPNSCAHPAPSEPEGAKQ